MKKTDFFELLKAVNVHFTDGCYADNCYDKFDTYYEKLISYNQKVNLTAITNKDEVFVKHFADSLSLLGVCDIKKGSRLIDVGSGAGFPGLPVKIAREDLDVTLLDSLQKRVAFLEKMIELLELDNATAIHARAEELGTDKLYRQKYDVAVSRAVANMPTLLEYLSPFVKKCGRIILLKGAKTQDEIDSSQNAMKQLGLQLSDCKRINLSDDANEHFVVSMKKVQDTPQRYPRKMSQIKKNPL